MSTSETSTPMNVNENEEQGLLDAMNDRYGGVIVEVTQPMDSALFASVLRASMQQWRQQVFFLTFITIFTTLFSLFLLDHVM